MGYCRDDWQCASRKVRAAFSTDSTVYGRYCVTIHVDAHSSVFLVLSLKIPWGFGFWFSWRAPYLRGVGECWRVPAIHCCEEGVPRVHPTTGLGGPQEKMSFFQIASGPILSIPIHSNTCQYDPCTVLLKKKWPLPYLWTPQSQCFLAVVTGLVTD